MRKKKQEYLLSLTLVVALMLLARATALAQGSSEFQLVQFAVGGTGSMTSADGVFALIGTMGQPGVGRLTGSGWSVEGGFWGGGQTVFGIHLPFIQR